MIIIKRLIRVSVIIREDSKILLVNMKRKDSNIFVFPGGTLEQGESLFEGAIREVKEETNLDIRIIGLRYFKELFTSDDESIDFIFEGEIIGGLLKKGFDPEYLDNQPLHDVLWVEISDLSKLKFHPKQLISFLKETDDSAKYLGRFEYPEN